MSIPTTTMIRTGDAKHPESPPFREMVLTPQRLFRTGFLGTPVPARAPSRAPNPRNAKHQHCRVPSAAKGADGSARRAEEPLTGDAADGAWW